MVIFVTNKIKLMSIKEKEQFQLERLQSTLNRGYKNIPFHQNRFQKNGILPSDISSIKDIAKLPFMDRSHLGKYYPYGLFAVPLRDIVRIHTAPGTGINPTVSGYTRTDLIIWQKLISNALIATGITATDIIQINLPPGLANWGRDYKDGGEFIGASVIPNTQLSINKTLMVLRDYKTTALITTFTFAQKLAEEMFKIGLNPTSLNLKKLILTGEPVSKEKKNHLKQQFHAGIWIHYGLSEIPGTAIAFECSEHNGVHISDDFFLPEIINPVTKEPVKNTEKGELVLTTLATRAFPLIRFRTGDIAKIISTPCPCGSPHIKIEWFNERSDNLMNISGVKVSKEQIMFHLGQTLGYSPTSCNIVRQQHGGADYIEVWVVVDDSLFSDEIKELERFISTAGEQLGYSLGVPVKIKLKEK